MIEPVVRDGCDPRAVCPDCGAFLQWIVRNAQPMLRCPWARDDSWRIFPYDVTIQQFCAWPLGSARIPGGVAQVSA